MNDARDYAGLRMKVLRTQEFAGQELPESWRDPAGISRTSRSWRDVLLGCPLHQDASDPFQILAIRESTVVGSIHLIPGEIGIGGATERVLWGSGLIVPEAFRGQGLATRIVQAWTSVHHTACGCGVADIAQKIYHKLGWHEVLIPGYVLPHRTGPFLDRFLRWRRARVPLRVLMDAGLGARARMLAQRKSPRRFRIQPAPRVSSEFDEVWGSPSRRLKLHRSAAWINWLLEADKVGTRGRSRAYYVVDEYACVVAYFLIRSAVKNFPRRKIRGVVVGSIKDWTVFDHSRVRELDVLLLAARELLRWDVDVVQTYCADRKVARGLRRAGFLNFGELSLVCAARTPSLLATEDCHAVRSQVRPAEGDNFFNP